ncbi:uncharacterized protein MEPE_05655 [Melanopsichium pennsylvanicum]|uniref:Shugoshin C-terminal domain-containing protein n=2 Tax=Melanopsichium pennsylvanicum TaxID=63383 RepID=A0AAJ4XS90_9BASI|nr:putative protein [Melanopsichium pennsylvanicum 4]SNX86946.1 uncharacterized protein MEPE_05655 [Melanopsichium pennsylvanicum]
MPPATRREVRLSASLPHPTDQNGASHNIESSRSANFRYPNMESILENFEHFKRKHISQNREIIKANAVAQLRIRDLENRIQTLEAEKAQKEVDTIGLTVQVDQLHHAIGCIHAGWQAIGRGLALGAADFVPSQLPASNRVTVEPNPNAAAVVRSVARPPEGHIESWQEEKSQSQIKLHPSDTLSRFASEPQPFHDKWHPQLGAFQSNPSGDAAENPISALGMDGAPSPLGSPELPIELEDAIAAATSGSNSRQWSPSDVAVPHQFSLDSDSAPFEEHDPSRSSSRQFLHRSGRKSSRRQSGFLSQSEYSGGPLRGQSPDHDSDQSTPAPSSDSYLPSDTNSETMDGLLVYRGGDQSPVIRSSTPLLPPAPLVDITNGVFTSASSYYNPARMHKDDSARNGDATPRKARSSPPITESTSRDPYEIHSANLTASEARTPGGRKRKVPAHEPQDPMPVPSRLFSAATEAAPSVASAAEEADSEPQTGRVRRVRKSINYALPKLNTKMRKPDPSDLVPASTPRRSTSKTPASARGMIGSTGNLSDIRKLHEQAAQRQSPAERTSNMRSKASPSREDDGGIRMADLFEIRQNANQQADEKPGLMSKSSTARSFWGIDSVTDTSDDDSRATSNADLGDLAELEAAFSDLCTADDVHQADTPRVPQSYLWTSRSSVQMSASSSSDSITSNGTKRPSLRRKTTALPNRSRQSSVELALQADAREDVSPGVEDAKSDDGSKSQQANSIKAEPTLRTQAVSTGMKDSTKSSATAQNAANTKKMVERNRTESAASSSTETGNGKPSLSTGGLAAGMKPKQRPASAGAALVGARSPDGASSASNGVERPRTFSGTTAANAGLTPAAASNGPTGSAGRSATSTSIQRASLHSALTKAAPGQVTPRIGAKGLPVSTMPSVKESPHLRGTPILRPALSTSGFASESSGPSSPALSVASTGSSGTQLSTSTRTSLKTSSSISGVTQQAKTQRPGTAGSTSSSLASHRGCSTPRLTGPISSSSLSSTRPQPARSMPSLRRLTDKAGVTSTPRITVRSSSSTLPPAAAGSNVHASTIPAASIAASKVAKAIASTPSVRAKASSAPTGLGIDFSSMMNESSAGRDLIHLTDEIHQVLQSSSDPSSSLSSQAHSSSPLSASKTSGSDDTSTSGASAAKARRGSRRVSGMTA